MSADAIMNIISDGEVVSSKDTHQNTENTETEPNINVTTSSSENSSPQPEMSYARASQLTGAVPKVQRSQLSNRPNATPRPNIMTNQINDIVANHNAGARILILMRGAPGSGKSYLAKQIVSMTVSASSRDYDAHILSTDDFFKVRGSYWYDVTKLSEAHDWNQRRSYAAMEKGLSPIIIDNTNIEIWEMEPYTRHGVINGYIIEVVEPNTPWAFKAYELSKKNSHNVPIQKIRKMLDRYHHDITGDILRQHFQIEYSPYMIPSVARILPAIEQINLDVQHSNIPGNLPTMEGQTVTHISTDLETEGTVDKEVNSDLITADQSGAINYPQFSQDETVINNELKETISHVESAKQSGNYNPDSETYLKVQKQLEEFEKFEQEWEKGEKWDTEQGTSDTDSNTEPKPPDTSAEPKPPEKKDTDSLLSDNLLQSLGDSNDWSKITMFMPSWDDNSKSDINTPKQNIETKSCGTTMQFDFDNSEYKILDSKPRDINFSYSPPIVEKIPIQRRLDKSTMTSEALITDTFRCKNEEKHFAQFRKLFKEVHASDLREIFDKCCGDVNWAVNIALDGIANDQVRQAETDEDEHEIEEELEDQCDCTAVYNIIPDKATSRVAEADTYVPEGETSNVTVPPQKKNKKGVSISQSSVELKKQIEKNIVISDNHYSQQCLKIRKFRRGETDPPRNLEGTLDAYVNSEDVPKPSSSTEAIFDSNCSQQSLQITKFGHEETQPPTNLEEAFHNYLSMADIPEPSTFKVASSTNSYAVDILGNDDDSSVSFDEEEETVTVDLKKGLLQQLDDLYCRSEMVYPEYIVPQISVPISIMQEINALWLESVVNQLDEHTRQNQLMIQQDEEFARQLQLKEQELAQAGKEPAVPDLKEIMDMELALSLYQKDVNEWVNKQPQDMAARMSRDKLYNLFPEVDEGVLAQVIAAHGHDFAMTVEVLLTSTGKFDVLREKDGINKFVMRKEKEQLEKKIAEEKQSWDVSWPALPKDQKGDMALVAEYRQSAEMHLASRNKSYEIAQQYMQKGMTEAAAHYSNIASYHQQKFDQMNSMAAAAVIQLNFDEGSRTLDLHYLKVIEARDILDIFLDGHISELRKAAGRQPHSISVFVITGRGLHSLGKPRIKPATKSRLVFRGIKSYERNPGLLSVKLSAKNFLTSELRSRKRMNDNAIPEESYTT